MSTMLEDTRPRETMSVADVRRAKQHCIVIIGGGFAGIAAARALRRSDADVVLIDRRNHHIFQPLLYQVATAVLAPSEIAAPIRQLAQKQKNLSVMLAEVTGVDLKSRSIEAFCPGLGVRNIPFDFLVVATGMRPSYFGHDEFAKYAPGLKNLNEAETIRTKILSAYELAEVTDDQRERSRLMTFVLVGAGATGVELAASMAQMAAVTLRGNFRRIDPAKSSIVLQSRSSELCRGLVEEGNWTTRETRRQGCDGSEGRKSRRTRRHCWWKKDSERDRAVDGWGRAVTARANARCKDRSRGSGIRWTVYECSGCAWCIRRRRYSICHARRTAAARRRAGGHPARALCGTPDFRAAQRAGAQTSISLL